MTIGGHAHKNNATSCHASIQTTESYLCYVYTDIGDDQCEAADTQLMLKKQQLTDHDLYRYKPRPLLIQTTPLTTPCWLWYSKQQLHHLSLHWIELTSMFHQNFSHTISCLTKPCVDQGHRFSQHNNFLFVGHMCSHIQSVFFSLWGDFSQN